MKSGNIFFNWELFYGKSATWRREGNSPAERLYCKKGSEWVKLPEWFRFLISIGSRIAKYKPGNKHLLLGLSLPTRVAGAVAVSCGIVAERAKSRADADDWLSRLEKLKSMEVGSSVYLISGGKRIRGKYLGLTEKCGGMTISVQVTCRDKYGGGDGIRFIPVRQAAKVLPLISDLKPLTPKQKEKELIGDSRFLHYILDEVDLDNFTGTSRTDCVIVGSFANIRSEVRAIPVAVRFAMDNYTEMFESNLGDILRVREFLGDRAPFRTVVLPTAAEEKEIKTGNPHTVVFDGMNGYRKMSKIYSSSHQVLILDRSDHSIGKWKEVLRQMPVKRTVADDFFKELSNVPEAVEIMACLEYRNERN